MRNLAGMCGAFPAISLILVLTFSSLAVVYIIGLGHANPYRPAGDVPPRWDTTPPEISVFYPKINTAYKLNHFVLNFTVSPPTGPLVESPWVAEIYYKADWQQNNITVYEYRYPMEEYSDFSSEDWLLLRPKTNNLNVTGIPEGNHSITLYARYVGYYPGSYAMSISRFSITGSQTISFTVDTTPPSISVLSLENETYDASGVPLDFTVNETVSQISYVLDGQENVTVSGNVTLSDLSEGSHSITVYAEDAAGNVGASETVTFTIAKPEPFPTTPIVVASVASASVAGVGLLVYFRKRRR